MKTPVLSRVTWTMAQLSDPSTNIFSPGADVPSELSSSHLTSFFDVTIKQRRMGTRRHE